MVLPKAVEVKWNKQVFSSVDLPATSDELRTHLRGITGVLEDRQTLMCKNVWKGVLGKGVNLAELPWPEDGKATIVLMGTPSEKAKIDPPKDAVTFVEDMSIGAAAAAGKRLPPGLHNLGNTCYMNATLQVLRGAPELVGALSSTPIGSGRDAGIPAELKNLYSEMTRTTHAEVVPTRFVSVVRNAMPRFSEKNNRGEFVQQDADEFYQELMSALGRSLKDGDKSIVDDYFGVELSVKTKCLEDENEAPSMSFDSMKRMQCIINETVTHLSTGLKLGLEGEVEKFSESLNRNARYSQTKHMARCPKYLTIQLNRFFWKLTPESRDHRGVSCKILKAVKFPQVLDVFEFCDEQVQAVLKVQRDLKSAKIMDSKKAKTDPNPAPAPQPKADEPGDVEMDEESEELRKALAMSMVDDATLQAQSMVLGKDVPQTFSGRYELVGVVSHKGRSSSSGHYMGWVRSDTNPSKWTCFDDDHPSECEWSSVDALAGGGDHHMAFILLYRASAD